MRTQPRNARPVVGAADALAQTMTPDEREAFADNLERAGHLARATMVRDGGAR